MTSVRWGQASHAFELRSPDPRVLSRAALIFRSWPPPRVPAFTSEWSVVPRQTSDAWTLHCDGEDIATVSGPPARAVTAVEFRALRALVEGPPDVLTLHAALVAREGRGVLVIGPNEAGKSTLACALWGRGFSLLGDDLAIVDPATAKAQSAPRRVSLRTASRELLGESLWARMLAAPSSEATPDGYVFHPGEVDQRPCPSVVPLSAFVFLARRGATVADGQVEACPPGNAVLALLPYSNLIRRLDPWTVIHQISPLAGAVPAYDLGRGPLSTMVTVVERLLDGSA